MRWSRYIWSAFEKAVEKSSGLRSIPANEERVLVVNARVELADAFPIMFIASLPLCVVITIMIATGSYLDALALPWWICGMSIAAAAVYALAIYARQYVTFNVAVATDKQIYTGTIRERADGNTPDPIKRISFDELDHAYWMPSSLLGARVDKLTLIYGKAMDDWRNSIDNLAPGLAIKRCIAAIARIPSRSARNAADTRRDMQAAMDRVAQALPPGLKPIAGTATGEPGIAGETTAAENQYEASNSQQQRVRAKQAKNIAGILVTLAIHAGIAWSIGNGIEPEFVGWFSVAFVGAFWFLITLGIISNIIDVSRHTNKPGERISILNDRIRLTAPGGESRDFLFGKGWIIHPGIAINIWSRKPANWDNIYVHDMNTRRPVAIMTIGLLDNPDLQRLVLDLIAAHERWLSAREKEGFDTAMEVAREIQETHPAIGQQARIIAAETRVAYPGSEAIDRILEARAGDRLPDTPREGPLFRSPATHYVAKFSPGEKVEQVYHVERPGSVIRSHLPSIVISGVLIAAGVAFTVLAAMNVDSRDTIWYSLGSMLCLSVGGIATLLASCFIGGDLARARRVEIVFTTQGIHVTMGVAAGPDNVTRIPYDAIVEVACRKFDESARNFVEVTCRFSKPGGQAAQAPSHSEIRLHRLSTIPIAWLKAHGVHVRFAD